MGLLHCKLGNYFSLIQDLKAKHALMQNEMCQKMLFIFCVHTNIDGINSR